MLWNNKLNHFKMYKSLRLLIVTVCIVFSCSSGEKNSKYDLNGFFGNSGYQGKNRLIDVVQLAVFFLTIPLISALHSFLHTG